MISWLGLSMRNVLGHHQTLIPLKVITYLLLYGEGKQAYLYGGIGTDTFRHLVIAGRIVVGQGIMIGFFGFARTRSH